MRQQRSSHYNSFNMEDFSEIERENIPMRKKEKPSVKESILEFVKFAAIAVIVVIPIRLYVAQPFVVSGASMVPTFEDGNYLIIDEISYRFEEPKRGDVVVFRFPLSPSKFLIKRIVGLPKETVAISGNNIVIKNKKHPDGFLWKQGVFNSSGSRIDVTVSLQADEYFVLGDNRGESADSRIWGALKREFIVGRPLIRLFPLTDIEVFPGEWGEVAP